MNRMKLLANALMVCMLHLTAIAQIPDLEPKINITSLGKPLSVASDGYGQHVIYGPSSTLTHKLLDNTGNVIASHSNNLNVADAYSPVVNTHGGKVYVVMTNFAADRMKLRFSLDGGASWIPLPDHQIPPAQIVENASISAFTDDNGVHVVWSLPFSGADPSKKVHYIRYDQSLNAWVGYKEVTDVNSNGGAVAKVITSGNTAVVAFLDAKPFGPQPPYDDILTSRDLDVPTETWATFYHQIPETDPVNFTSLNLTRIASTIHAGLKSYSSGIGGGLRVLAERGLSSGWVINNYLGQGFDVAMGSSQGVLHTLSNRVEEIGFDQLDQSMELIRWPTGPTWALDHMLVPINSTYFYGEKLTTSQTGIYSFWTHGYFSPDIAHFLQRRPAGLLA